ncbi:MAG: U32 family peptidase, partial [Thermoguttaceae bacterium]
MDLPRLMDHLHARGVRGYLTLNTLVFDDELPSVERLVRLAVQANVDAVLVQDLGLLRLVHRLCPELPLHASTQMTLSSAECLDEVRSLGIRRVVLPRELSVAEVAAIRRQTDVELEVFVHGALCLSYSGQCLASLSLGGRSANRGRCAQPCRLPYQVVTDSGFPRDCRYPLSPHDLAAYDRVSELCRAGVSALKIEGRLKPPEYVAVATRCYREILDALCCPEGATPPGDKELAELEMAFSRGFCHGWLDGDDHQALVSGRGSSHRGMLLGRVRGVRGDRIVVELSAPVQRGDGVVFEADRSQGDEQGGRVYEIFQNQRSLKAATVGSVELAFRYGSIDRSRIHLDQKVWKTDDPRLAQRIHRRRAGRDVRPRAALDLTVEAASGGLLHVTARTDAGFECRIASEQPLAEATRHPLTAEMLTEQFGRLGQTPYRLRRLEACIDGRPMAPLSVLGQMRRELVERLNAAQWPRRTAMSESALTAIEQEIPPPCPAPTVNLRWHVLCRSLGQVEAALDVRPDSVMVDCQQPDDCDRAARAVRSAGVSLVLATPRIHKPGESDVLESLAQCRPDAVLVRNLAGLAFFRSLGVPMVADFSLNAVNRPTLAWLVAQGAQRVTAAYDLDERRLLDLAAAVEPGRLEVIVHRHTPMFHSEHCL